MKVILMLCFFSFIRYSIMSKTQMAVMAFVTLGMSLALTMKIKGHECYVLDGKQICCEYWMPGEEDKVCTSQ